MTRSLTITGPGPFPAEQEWSKIKREDQMSKSSLHNEWKILNMVSKGTIHFQVCRKTIILKSAI